MAKRLREDAVASADASCGVSLSAGAGASNDGASSDDGVSSDGASGDDVVSLVVGQHRDRFTVSRRLLTAAPHAQCTMLGTMFAESNRVMWEGKAQHNFPDNNADVFRQVVLPFYEHGVLRPNTDDPITFLELDFWQVRPINYSCNELTFPWDADSDALQQRLALGCVADLSTAIGMVRSNTADSPSIFVPLASATQLAAVHWLCDRAPVLLSELLTTHAMCSQCHLGCVTHF